MIRISQINMPLRHTDKDLLHKTAKILRIDSARIQKLTIIKKSIDARKKPELFLVYTVDVKVDGEEKLLQRQKGNQIQKAQDVTYRFPLPEGPREDVCHSPIIIGTGPAGLFCGYMLAKHGFRPILLERGKAVEERVADVAKFWESGTLLTNSNVQFGEGGAGTFSDGKLNTLVKDKYGRNREVLRIFVEAGAPEEILYEAKPHIGTDKLIEVVQNLRKAIIRWGGSVHFDATVTDILVEDGQIKGVVINDDRILNSDIVVPAIGHSARDTFQMLYKHKLPMEAKAFAVGLRMEHPREMIDALQYGRADVPLPAASYKVTARTVSGRGVYSFCMCPGGYVVNASSEMGRTAVNGMSYSGRNGENSNSAMIVTVTPEDFGSDHPLAGISFQRDLEERAFQIGKGEVPVERYGDFHQAVAGTTAPEDEIRTKYPAFAPAIKGRFCEAPVHEILPPALNAALVEGIDQIGRHMKGFADGGAYLSGVESRTSSPVRIVRDETGQSAILGIYPCGEGAGYAGGITSAAMDGLLTAEKIALQYIQKRTDGR